MSRRYFFDTYALIRVVAGHSSYARFSEEPIVTDAGCTYELARHLLKVGTARDARALLASLRAERVAPTDDDLIETAKALRRMSKASPQDALGYVLARREGLQFLTGDGAFRGMADVEYVV